MSIRVARRPASFINRPPDEISWDEDAEGEEERLHRLMLADGEEPIRPPDAQEPAFALVYPHQRRAREPLKLRWRQIKDVSRVFV